MGVTYVEGQVKGPSNKQETVKFLVDSGATYSSLPKAVWESNWFDAETNAVLYSRRRHQR